METLGYNEVFTGVGNLTDEQLLVALERIKYLLKNRNCDTNIIKTQVQQNIMPIKNELKETGMKPCSEIECCLHCGSISIKKFGRTKGGIQRYFCKDCHKTFAENYGLITHYTHLAEYQWLEIIRGIITGSSITEISKNINVSKSTVWLCRTKIFQMLKNVYGSGDTLTGVVTADGTYERISFKGKKDKQYFINTLGRLPRHHRSREERIEYLGEDYNELFTKNPHLLKEMIFSSQKKMVGRDTIDINHQLLCILTAIDRADNIYIEPVTSGTPKAQDIYGHLAPRLDRCTLLVTDQHNGYKYLANKNDISHKAVLSSEHTCNGFSLAAINNVHSALKEFWGCGEYKPATKYIDLYLSLFWWKQKQKEASQLELMKRLFNIVTGNVSNETRSNMGRITNEMLVNRELPIDTKGFY